MKRLAVLASLASHLQAYECGLLEKYILRMLLQLHVRPARFLENERLASQHFDLKTKGKPLFFYQVSHQMFDSSSSPEGTVSQAKCHQVTKSLGRERLDLFHFVLKALYKLLYTCNSGISIHKHMHSLYFVHGFI